MFELDNQTLGWGSPGWKTVESFSHCPVEQHNSLAPPFAKNICYPSRCVSLSLCSTFPSPAPKTPTRGRTHSTSFHFKVSLIVQSFNDRKPWLRWIFIPFRSKGRATSYSWGFMEGKRGNREPQKLQVQVSWKTEFLLLLDLGIQHWHLLLLHWNYQGLIQNSSLSLTCHSQPLTISCPFHLLNPSLNILISLLIPVSETALITQCYCLCSSFSNGLLDSANLFSTL